MRLPLSRPIATLAVLALALGVAIAPNRADAQTPETPAARADRLFREGKAALEANRFAQACPQLAESQRLDPGTGTLLALALCHEGNGQTATAWREFKDVVTASQKTRADRAALASQHVRALEPSLSTVTLSVPDELRTVVRVHIDGEEIPVSAWSAPIPLDPGDHVVEASTPGVASPWKTSVHLGANGDRKQVSVPRADRPTTPAIVAVPQGAPAPSPESPSPGMEMRHKIGWGVGGAGALSIVIGAVFGGLALSKASSAHSLCPTSQCKDPTGVADNDSAKTDAWGSDVAIGLGLAAAGTGAYLLLTHDSTQPAAPSQAQARVVPVVGPGGAGLSLVGAW